MAGNAYSVYLRFLSQLIPLAILLSLPALFAFEWYRFQISIDQLDKNIRKELATSSILLAHPVSRQDLDQIRLIIAHSISNPHVQQVEVSLQTGEILDSYGKSSSSKNCQMLSTSINHIGDQQVERLGTLTICYSIEKLREAYTDNATETAVLVFILLLTTVFVAYVSYRNTVGIPLTRLATAINNRLSLQRSEPVEWSSKDEIGRVINEFNAMQVAIEHQEKQSREHQKNLESAIEERTRDLAEKTKEANLRTEQAQQELSLRNQIQATLSRSNEILMNLSGINSEDPQRNLFDHLLEHVVDLSESGVGLIGEVIVLDSGPAIRVLGFHARGNAAAWQDFYIANGPGELVIARTDNLLGEVVTTRKTVFSNNFATDQRKGNRQPDNHPPLQAFLGLPIKDIDDNVVGVVGLGNRAGGYNQHVVDQIEPLLAAANSILVTYRNLALRQIAEHNLQQTNTLLAAQQETLAAIEQEISVSDADQNVLPSVIRQSARQLDASSMSVWTLSRDGRAIDRVALHSVETTNPPETIVINQETFAATIISSGSVITIRDEPHPFIPGPDKEHEARYVLPIVAGQTIHGVLCIDYKDGGLSSNDTMFARAVVGLVNIVLQRERSREIHAELQQSQKMEAIGRLAGGIAHDFNNLLTAIIGFSDMAQQKIKSGKSGPELSDDIEQVLSTANRAATLTSQLLTFSRKEVVRLQAVDLHQVLGETLSMLRRVLRENITIETRFSNDNLIIHADTGQLEQVILNLAVNAGDAMPSGGDLTISTRLMPTSLAQNLGFDSSQYAILEFTDSGSGISQENLQKIFEPFFSTKEGTNSVGLGLSTVHSIVSETSGHVTVESELNSGATFTIYLPLSEQSIDYHEAQVNGAPSTHRKARVLVAEDEPLICELVQMILEDEGHKVAKAPDGEDALALYTSAEEPFDLLVTDMIMPGMNGIELAARARQQNPDLAVLFISGYTDDALGERRDSLPANSLFLQNPFLQTN